MLKSLHRLSSRHRDAVLSSTTCGCFYCLKRFSPTTIAKWTDQKQTALCPHCGIDSVLPENGIASLSDELLRVMKQVWFQRRPTCPVLNR
ncbi:MAG: cytoplasmic protein [Tepidisphaera sp.]|nr:cytoplasmic protein [Tepidisphaera sp.]